jgi:glycosyltransferase involved in cell wall biosynthesis
MAAGATIVASRVGGIPEIVDDGQTGLLFERGDSEQLGRRLRRALTEPTLADRLGVSARAEAERRFSPRAHWTQLTEVYRRCLAPAVARSLRG